MNYLCEYSSTAWCIIIHSPPQKQKPMNHLGTSFNSNFITLLGTLLIIHSEFTLQGPAQAFTVNKVIEIIS